MPPLSSVSLTNTLTSPPLAATVPVDSNLDSLSGETPLSAKQPVVVTISAEGQEKLQDEQNKNADIDASHLPDGIKKYLKSIRDLQEQIDKKLKELQAAMSDSSLSDKERESKISRIRLVLSVLNSSLTSITDDLHQKEVEMRLQAPDLTLINSLMAPR